MDRLCDSLRHESLHTPTGRPPRALHRNRAPPAWEWALDRLQASGLRQVRLVAGVQKMDAITAESAGSDAHPSTQALKGKNLRKGVPRPACMLFRKVPPWSRTSAFPDEASSAAKRDNPPQFEWFDGLFSRRAQQRSPAFGVPRGPLPRNTHMRESGRRRNHPGTGHHSRAIQINVTLTAQMSPRHRSSAQLSGIAGQSVTGS